ncbi:Geranylgeranyl transferase type-2 subunit alpha 1 [Glycine max]|nr:Geranylgeranyl transferase type-2 subunit alpha 1 [Glycine max]KAH1261227.1 Geranylgeranyl transferase type-2 subunit alpha 1 [Glycine max]
MHGQPRKALKQEDEAALSAKAEKLRSLQAQFLANHHNNIYSKETLDVSATQLGITESSPFNIFSLIIPIPIPTLSSKMSSNLCVLILIVEIALRKNFKSYGAWHHRKWVLSKGHSSMDNEMRLLNGFQKADPRNFHAWNCRWFVVELIKQSDED